MLGCYLLTVGGQTFISDGEIMLLSAVQLIDEQRISLPDWAYVFPQVVQGADSALYSRYGLGQPLLAGLFYWFGRYVVGWYLLPGSNDFLVGKFFAMLLPMFATALTGGIICLWASRLYRSHHIGITLALLYGTGSLAFPYARFFFSEPLFTCCLVVACYAIYRHRPYVAGFAYGYAVATRIGGGILLPALFLYAWRKGSKTRDFVKIALGGIPSVLLILAYNWARFHSFAEYGYVADKGFTGNVVVGLYGLLFSPGKSVFLYVPLLLLLPWYTRPFMQRFPAEGWLIASVVLLTLLQSASWWMWWAGWGWGPRFLVPLMPLLVLPLGHGAQQANHWGRLPFFALWAASLAMNMLGILVNFNDYLIALTHGIKEREMIYLFNPVFSPVLAHIARLHIHAIPIVSFSLNEPVVGFPRYAAPWITGGFVVLVVVSASKLWMMARD